MIKELPSFNIQEIAKDKAIRMLVIISLFTGSVVMATNYITSLHYDDRIASMQENIDRYEHAFGNEPDRLVPQVKPVPIPLLPLAPEKTVGFKRY